MAIDSVWRSAVAGSGESQVPQSREVPHASEVALSIRIAAYVAVLLGYVFYCYNYIVVGFVRPYLVSQVGFSISDTALITMAGNVGVTIGAIVWSHFVARAGRRKAVILIATGIGTLAVLQAATRILGVWIGLRFFMDGLLGGYYVVATSLVVALFPAKSRAKLIALNSAMYPGANILIGVLGGWLGDAHWTVLLWLAAMPLPIAVVLFFAVPKDSNYAAYDDEAGSGTDGGGRWSEMFAPRLRWIMAGCILLSGLDFNAWQLFQGFVTLYVKNTLGMTAAAMGAIVAFTSAGSFIGNFFWAIIADRFGRKVPLIGYILAAVMVLVFVQPGLDQTWLSLFGFVFGFGMSCTTAWGAWFAELFPVRLRPFGAALFHIGHVMALGAPLLAAYTTQHLGITTSMSLASVVYVAGAALWFALPETRKGGFKASVARDAAALAPAAKEG
ncbi:MFS transporter [Novosphingobium sp. Gsoil 351]|uniref:MFS transporter n=1 Tax=Novosphingobium sp. Gsoil 351 TaxID=2675225 RepID=UPI0012B4693B|nr:MFS transporter [Novosphingobium sp. Gsoil 351]QGN54502.1 MFS transporter [Novosphingobium sp. Gsoil 351]